MKPAVIQKAAYEPSPWGQRFHDLTCHEALGGGAAGGGKTIALLMDPLLQITVEHLRCQDRKFIPPGFTEPQPLRWGSSQGMALFLRRVTPMLRYAVRESKMRFPQIDPGATWNERDAEWTFSSGYKYRFGHCKDKDDWWLYQGDQYSWLGFDELTQFTSEQYDQIGSRVRISDPVLAGMVKVRAMSNPYMDADGMDGVSVDENPHWVRDLFVEPYRNAGVEYGDGVLTRPVRTSYGLMEWTRVFLPAKLSDNPDQSFARSYELRLSTRKPHVQKALLDGDWYITAGSFYADVWDEQCIIPAFKLPDTWVVFRSMDWGFKAPGCVQWWAFDEDDVLICVREQMFQGQTATEVAKMIRSVEEGMGIWKLPQGRQKGDKRSPITGPADTQLWEKRGETGPSKAEEMAAQGVGWVPADKKSRQRNAELLYKRLKDRVAGKPSIKFFRKYCQQITKIVPTVGTNPNNMNEPADGGFDHPLDACLYACAFAARGPVGMPKRKKRDFDWDEDDPKPVKADWGTWGYGS